MVVLIQGWFASGDIFGCSNQEWVQLAVYLRRSVGRDTLDAPGQGAGSGRVCQSRRCMGLLGVRCPETTLHGLVCPHWHPVFRRPCRVPPGPAPLCIPSSPEARRAPLAPLGLPGIRCVPMPGRPCTASSRPPLHRESLRAFSLLCLRALCNSSIVSWHRRG